MSYPLSHGASGDPAGMLEQVYCLPVGGEAGDTP